MFVAAAGQAGSGLNPAYYSLGGAATGERAARSLTYDARTRTAYVSFGNLSADEYTLTADAALTSRNGQRLGVHYSTDFSAFGDISIDRQSVVAGQRVSVRVDLVGCSIIENKNSTIQR